jgi:hypothetical protein
MRIDATYRIQPKQRRIIFVTDEISKGYEIHFG